MTRRTRYGDWSRVEKLFEEALELQAPEQERFLLESEPSADLRAQVLELLRIARASTGFLSVPSAPAPQGAPGLDIQPGDRIAAYAIERLIGSGGMGRVYEARQETPRRKIALKVLHSRHLSGPLVRRFEFEAEVLGSLHHAAIAQIHQAGVHRHVAADATFEIPFLAMEYIEAARTLIDHVREGELSLRARLLLFHQVCRGVQHAHERGIIHRDLKPANILVGPDGGPKIIDFGVARAVDSRSENLTHHGEVFGTLSYMSPEQLSGDPNQIDTRSDIHALGAILHEILTQKALHDVQGMSLGEAIEAIQKKDVASELRRKPLPEELRWILVKATERDPGDRYASAAELAADILRYLDKEPVLAGPPTTLYRARKLLERHRVLVSFSALLILSLAGGLLATFLLFREARTARDVAREQERKERETRLELEKQYERTSKVSDFLVRVLQSTNPLHRAQDTRVSEVLDAAAIRLANTDIDDRETLIKLNQTLAVSYQEVGKRDKALVHARTMLALLREELPENHPRILHARVACVLYRPDDVSLDDARAELEKILACVPKHTDLDEDERQTQGFIYSTLAGVEKLAGNLERAEAHARKSLEYRRPGSELLVLANILIVRGKLKEAREVLLQLQSEADGNPIREGEGHVGLAYLAGLQEHFAEARDHYQQAIQCFAKAYQGHHHQILSARASLAVMSKRLGQVDRAERAYREILEACRGKERVEESIRVMTQFNLATLLRQQGEREEARVLYVAAMEGAREHLEPHYQVELRLGYSGFLFEQKDLRAVREQLTLCRSILEGASGLSGTYRERVERSFEILRGAEEKR